MTLTLITPILQMITDRFSGWNKKKLEDIGTNSGCQQQAIGTQCHLCWDRYPVCMLYLHHAECVCHNFRKQSVCQLQANGTQGCLCLYWHPICVPYFENTEYVCQNFRKHCVCYSTSSSPHSLSHSSYDSHQTIPILFPVLNLGANSHFDKIKCLICPKYKPQRANLIHRG